MQFADVRQPSLTSRYPPPSFVVIRPIDVRNVEVVGSSPITSTIRVFSRTLPGHRADEKIRRRRGAGVEGRSAATSEVRVGGVGGLDGLERAEGLSQDCFDDLAFVDVELLEDRLIEGAAEVGNGFPVESLGVLEESERCVDECGADLELVVATFELSFELGSFVRNAMQPFADGASWVAFRRLRGRRGCSLAGRVWRCVR